MNDDTLLPLTDPLTGKRRIRYHAFKGAKREAALELARLVSANTKGEYVDPRARR